VRAGIVPSMSDHAATRFSGFCIGGYAWPVPEVTRDMARHEELSVRRRLAAQDARLIRELEGNMVRIFWALESLVIGDAADVAAALNTLVHPALRNDSVFMRTPQERIEHLDRAVRALTGMLAAARGEAGGAFTLDWEPLDAVLAGIEDVNRGSAEPVRLLLSLVSAPPRYIVEAPSDATLAAAGRSYTSAGVWDLYVRVHQAVHRALIVRYAVERPLIGLCALEIVNEPDYAWIPQEMKIEFAADGPTTPVWKYVTELHLSQVPASDAPAPPFEQTAWGFQSQDAPWVDDGDSQHTPVLDFAWGVKFDWYVKCFAGLQAHVAWAIKDEAAARCVDVATVSGSVTHNNIDYLLRAHRADPRAFTYIDKIGVHPYHWRRNDVWDSEFVTPERQDPWPPADPRVYAAEHFKRFDFLEAFSGNSGVAEVDREIAQAFGQRPLWVTEFGIGSKVLGSFNAAVPESTRFIRPRGAVGAAAGYADCVWEDLWSAFLDQVDARWLTDRRVECLLLYALRELGVPGFDLDDEDRSNLALLRRDSTARLEPAVIDRVSGLLGEFLGSAPKAAAPRGTEIPGDLYRRPWRSVSLPERAKSVLTMLSLEERRLLYWLTATRYEGAGAIVDGGCFVGGSTVALAEGLRAAGRCEKVDVYDLFEVEAYMVDFYFKGMGLRPGESFRGLFDRNLEGLHDLLTVHAGDLTATRWRGEPIEVLFIDFAKAWTLNDFIVAEFFPSLIPGRSIVVQQDFVYAGCPWVILTMEQLSDYFEPVGFAEYCSVVYVCTRQVPDDIDPISALDLRERMRLIDRAIRRFRGYPRDVLECAKATLLVEHGDREQADAILDRVEAENGEHFAVAPALQLVRSFA
jgi:hypothetical protein